MRTLRRRVRSIFAASAAFLMRCRAMGLCGEIDLVLLEELLEDVVDHPVVEVHAAQEGVTAGGEHLEDVAGELEHGHVEGAAAQIVHEDLLIQAAVEAVGERGGGGLVDDALDVEAGQAARLLHRVALVVVVVGRDGDDGFLDGPAEELLGDGLHLPEDEAGHVRQGVRLAAQHHRRVPLRALDDVVVEVALELLHHLGVVLAPDEPLGAVERVLRVGDHLVLGDAADQEISLARERDHGRQDQVAAVGGDDLRDAVAHRRDQRVGRAQVNPDDARFVRHENREALA